MGPILYYQPVAMMCQWDIQNKIRLSSDQWSITKLMKCLMIMSLKPIVFCLGFGRSARLATRQFSTENTALSYICCLFDENPRESSIYSFQLTLLRLFSDLAITSTTSTSFAMIFLVPSTRLKPRCTSSRQNSGGDVKCKISSNNSARIESTPPFNLSCKWICHGIRQSGVPVWPLLEPWTSHEGMIRPAFWPLQYHSKSCYYFGCLTPLLHQMPCWKPAWLSPNRLCKFLDPAASGFESDLRLSHPQRIWWLSL